MPQAGLLHTAYLSGSTVSMLLLSWHTQSWLVPLVVFPGSSNLFVKILSCSVLFNGATSSVVSGMSQSLCTISMIWDNVHYYRVNTQYTNTSSAPTRCMFIWRVKTVSKEAEPSSGFSAEYKSFLYNFPHLPLEPCR